MTLATPNAESDYNFLLKCFGLAEPKKGDNQIQKVSIQFACLLNDNNDEVLLYQYIKTEKSKLLLIY